MARSSLLYGLLYEKSSWILLKNLMHKIINTNNNIYFALDVTIILLPLTSVFYILTVSNYQVCSNDEFDIWLVYSGERFRASWLIFIPHLFEEKQRK